MVSIHELQQGTYLQSKRKEENKMSDNLHPNNMDSVQLELHARGFWFDEDGKVKGLNPNFYAEYIQDNYEFIFAEDAKWHQFQDGVWVVIELSEFKSFLYEELQEPRFGVWTKYRELEYMTAMERLLHETKPLNSHRHLINLKNGMYDTKRSKLIPHDSKYLSTIQIPIEYDEEAECPKFDQFLDDIFESDEERITKAIEWYGYCLCTETKAQRALFLYGSGSNGKGVFTEILSKIVGEENISHVALNELQRNFSRATLFGKSLNIATETEMGGKSLNTQYFKAITGEDTINADFKGKQVFSFKPTAKLVMSMNNLPHTRDRSDGYYRRLDFLSFTRHFSENAKDRDLRAKLEKELPGIFNLALKGLKQLRDNSFKFSPCATSDAVLVDYKEELNPMIGFFEECVEVVDASHREDNKIIYNSFKKWAEDNGHKGYASVSVQRFWREFEAEAKSRGIKTESKRSSSFRYHTGFEIKNTTHPKYAGTRKKTVRKARPKAGNSILDAFGSDSGQSNND